MGSQLLFFVLVLSGFSLLCVQAQPLAPTTTDTLTQGNFIKDGETIISRKRVFELGFFTPPGADPAVRYLGIWYYNVTPQAVIWVANRNTSLRTRTGRFGISTNRNLELLEGGGANSTATVVWSSVSPSVPNASAVLMDSGNLVLRTTRGNTTVWESFANPGDTFMPGMRITVDRDSDEGNIVFKSWRSPSDPAVGRYSVGLDPSGSAQIYMWEDTSAGKKIRWRSGPWDGQVFVGTKMRPLFIFGFKLAEEQGRVSMTFSSAFNTSVLYRFVLQPDGVENTTTLDEKTKQWSQVWAQPVTACEFYNHCGANAECDDSTGSATCRCLHGYDPKSTDTWRKGDWSEGCVRRIRLQCQNGTSNGEDGFQKVEGIKPPDFAEWLPSSANEPLCREACLGNCSCRGYAFISNGCRVWARDLLDIHRFPGVSGSANGVIFLKLAAADLTAEGGKKNKTWVIALSVSLAAAAILLVCLCLWWRCRTRVQGTQDVKTGRNNSQSPFSAIDFTSYDPSSVGEDGKSSELPVYQFDCMVAATNNFSSDNLLGRGGFGEVYKGVLPSGQQVAVKRLSKTSGQGLEEFKTEAILIAKLQHRNLVRLLGCCMEKEEKMLIYEYLPNKSLDAFLFDPVKKEILDWRKRFDIIQGIAWGLLYLHRDSRLRIVHRDLKVSNILLDEDMNPKISDFGMARIFGANQNSENTTRVVGTFGYMSPEYAMEGLFSAKSDIYAFGVLVLEIISGKKNSTFHRTEGNTSNLIGHAWKLWKENRAIELADPSLGTSLPYEEIIRCIHIGILCVQDRAIDRPLMQSIVFMLGSESTTLPMPRQPTFTLDGSPGETESFSRLEQDYYTSSDVTFTSFTVRSE